ncbi:alanine racemase [Legionella birminghamensis]|uniref:Alanine racemase n=1 Tax=Legionella birminghamensis TaxID=28083 RepID=A0A378I864_9GAMM|nr:DSD1 family PLP-dependent enzyme [Legionella birminghamensis]KTC68257.1 alanine racemase [Legionella birminghamensis]STX31032.1 alanine racemase [Legionella birminghamensis]
MNKSSLTGIHKYQLDTPCLVIDKKKLEYNLAYMREHCLRQGIQLRPHCKTHKCSRLAEMQMDYGAAGLCVAKVSEALVLARNGMDHILITSPVVSNYKIQQLMMCHQLCSSLTAVVDNKENIRQLNNAALITGKALSVLIDVNSGIGRTGVNPEDALALGQFVQQMPGLRLGGIQCYAGNLQHLMLYAERKNKSLAVMEMASELLRQFRNAGLPCPILTGTGTGTFDIDCQASEVTEIQPGSYTVMDVQYTEIASAADNHLSPFQPAMTLLTTVISSNQSTHVTVDAGTKALYVDRCKPVIINRPGLEYDWAGFGDEHGRVYSPVNAPLPKNGDVLELIVPHCDPTINLHDHFNIIENDVVVDVWEIDMRGKCQ